MRRFIGDLHIHTCLSPCGELDMTPKRIIDKAVDRKLDIIAIADHNSAENLAVAIEIALKRGITLLPSIEITSSEEVHVLAIFQTLDMAEEMQEMIYKNLSGGINNERLFGLQVVVNEDDEVLRFNRKLLIGATNITLKTLVDKIHAIGGMAIASHADRHFGVISQLGFIPEDIRFDGIESANPDFKTEPDIPRITSSDAHCLDDIGKMTTALLLEEPSFREIAMALRQIDGRMVLQN